MHGYLAVLLLSIALAVAIAAYTGRDMEWLTLSWIENHRAQDASDGAYDLLRDAVIHPDGDDVLATFLNEWSRLQVDEETHLSEEEAASLGWRALPAGRRVVTSVDRYDMNDEQAMRDWDDVHDGTEG